MTGPSFHPLFAARLGVLDGVGAPSPSSSREDEAARRRFDAPFGPAGLPEVRVEEASAPGPRGDIPVRVYRPLDLAAESRIGLVWFHGGAFMVGDLDIPEADHFARQMAHRTGAVVVSVDYRLCDEATRFPVPHDDAYAAYRWTRDSAAELGIDVERLAVGGGSAGANLAASVAMRAGRDGVPASQMLLAYPVVHPVLPPASVGLAEALAITPAAVRFTDESSREINAFLLDRPLDEATDVEFPGLAADMPVFPRAYIENSQFDELRASGEAFAADLVRAGVEVEQVMARGVPHGHLNAVGSPMLEAAYGRFAKRLVEGSLAGGAERAQDLSEILGFRFLYTYANGWMYELYVKNATTIDYRIHSGHVGGRWVRDQTVDLVELTDGVFKISWTEPTGTSVSVNVMPRNRRLHGVIFFPQWIARDGSPTVVFQNEHLDEMVRLREAGPAYPIHVVPEFAAIHQVEYMGIDDESVISCPPSELPEGYAERII